jgi:hypothetical protein
MTETLIIDRVFPGVGRIKRACGTTKPGLRDAMSAVLAEFYNAGRLDVLRAIKTGRLSIMEVYDARKALHTLPLDKTAERAVAAMVAWRQGLGLSYEHRKSVQSSINRVERHKKTAQVTELPIVLEQLRESLGRAHPRSFNLFRSHVLSFLRDTLKRSHGLWIAASAVEPVKTTRGAKKCHPVTPAELWAWFPNPDADPVDAMTWSMAATGMGPNEYWGKWRVEADRVHIDGTKRLGRVRDVPLVRSPVPPTLSRRWWEVHFRQRTKRAMVPYDLRRSYAGWMEDAEIPRSRRKRYMGHGASDVTDLYERRDIDANLEADAARLTRHIERPTISPTILPLVRGKHV